MSEYNSHFTFSMDADLKKRFKMACIQFDLEMSEELRGFIKRRCDELEKQAKATKPKK